MFAPANTRSLISVFTEIGNASNFVSFCCFGSGDTLEPATSLDGNIIACMTSVHIGEGPVRLHLLNREKNIISEGLEFYFVRPLIITRVTPSIGSWSRSAVISVFGMNFLDMNSLLCKFDE